MKSHRVSLPNSACTGRPGGDAIHLLVAGAPWQIACLLPHLDAANRSREVGYYYLDFHDSSELNGESVEEDLASNWIVGKWTPLELESRLVHPGLGYPATPVVSLHDRPRMAARLVRSAREGGRVALGYLTVAPAHGPRFGIQFALAPDDEVGHRCLDELLSALDKLAGPDASTVFGPQTSPSETDAFLFATFALHLERNATAVLDHQRLTSPAIECVFRGSVTTVKNAAALVATLAKVSAADFELTIEHAA